MLVWLCMSSESIFNIASMGRYGWMKDHRVMEACERRMEGKKVEVGPPFRWGLNTSRRRIKMHHMLWLDARAMLSSASVHATAEEEVKDHEGRH